MRENDTTGAEMKRGSGTGEGMKANEVCRGDCFK